MMWEDDAVIREFLRQRAPNARDPLFRLQVHERRERVQFRRRALLASVLVLAALAIAVVGAGTLGPAACDAARVLFFGVLLALACEFYGPALAGLLPRFRR